ncbi:hypothetical protein QBC45DRAFT_419623, partial [Copromyces sp. CBS 386.78]
MGWRNGRRELGADLPLILLFSFCSRLAFGALDRAECACARVVRVPCGCFVEKSLPSTIVLEKRVKIPGIKRVWYLEERRLEVSGCEKRSGSLGLGAQVLVDLFSVARISHL